jgi:hypothetical protein
MVQTACHWLAVYMEFIFSVDNSTIIFRETLYIVNDSGRLIFVPHMKLS